MAQELNQQFLNDLVTARNRAFETGTATAEGRMPLTTMFSQAVENLPGSTVDLVEDTVRPFLEPIETAKSLFSLGKGIYQLAMPYGFQIPGQQDGPDEQSARAVGAYFADRYGSLEGAKRAFAEDPAGVLADASLIITGGSSLAATAPGAVGRAAQTVRRVADAADPLTMVTKAGNKIVRAVPEVAKSGLGMSTGAGRESIDQALQAGREGGARQQAFLENLRGEVPVESLASEASEALKDMTSKRNQQFALNKEILQLGRREINMEPVTDAIAEIRNTKEFQGVSELSQAAQKKLAQIEKLVDQWNSSPALHNAQGLDILKRRIDAEYPTSIRPGDAGMVVTQARNAVKKQIVEQVPAYEPLMKAYETAIELEQEMQKALSLGKKASADTILRKLQSVMRNNVNANFGSRLNLVKELDDAGDYLLLPKIAGQQMNTLTPRGFAPQVLLGGAVGQSALNLDPTAVLLAPLTSPRVVGEATRAVGAAQKMVNPVLQTIANNPVARAFLNNVSQQDILNVARAARPTGVLAEEANQQQLNEEQMRLIRAAESLRQ